MAKIRLSSRLVRQARDSIEKGKGNQDRTRQCKRLEGISQRYIFWKEIRMKVANFLGSEELL